MNLLSLIPKLPPIALPKGKIIVLVIIVILLAALAKILGTFRIKQKQNHMAKKQTKIMKKQAQYCINIISQIIGEIDTRLNNENDTQTLLMIKDNLYSLKYELANGEPITISPEQLSLNYQQTYQDYNSRIVGLFRELNKYIEG